MNDASQTFTTFLFAIIVYSIPLLYGTIGEIITEKSGSLNLGVEGTMAVGAIFGYLAGCYANSFIVGILVSMLASGLCGLLFAWLTVSMQANQNVTGLTITTFGLGLYFFIGRGVGREWPSMRDCSAIVNGFQDIKIPLLSDIPYVGKILFSHNILVYLGIIIAVIVWIYINKTKAGLRMRAVGESPSAADSIGVNIRKYKYIHIILGSAIMGIGGYYMGLNLTGSFEGSTCWINGYGWISIALVIFSNWNTLRAILGTFVFGFFNTLQIYNGSLAYAFPEFLGWLGKIPPQLFQALPFLITAIVLIIDSVRKNKHSGEPSAIGINYYREER
ncbi:MAG: ABC transporter permease [Clostridia bacterium]